MVFMASLFAVQYPARQCFEIQVTGAWANARVKSFSHPGALVRPPYMPPFVVSYSRMQQFLLGRHDESFRDCVSRCVLSEGIQRKRRFNELLRLG